MKRDTNPLYKLVQYCRSGNRWWLALVAGAAFGLCLPPFNHGTHPLLFPFPFLSLIVLLPLFAFSLHERRGRAVLHCLLFGMAASASQYYWIVFDTAEGVWHLIVVGVVLICAVFGLYYLAMGMLFRACRRFIPSLTLVVFPSLWVLGEYARTLGELSFPWMLLGYAWTPILPVAQLAAVGGVYGLSFVTVVGNVIAWRLACGAAEGNVARRDRRYAAAYAATLALITVLGGVRLATVKPSGDTARFCCLQQNLDHLHRGDHSLDSAFAAAEALAYQAADREPDCMVLAESSLQCFLVRQPWRARRVSAWVDSVDIPLVLGSLHWDRGEPGSLYKHLVYNTAFLVRPESRLFERYYKMKLVPFSEELPFEGVLPILSRVNLGEADFKRGREPTVFRIGDHVRGAPLICYEVIYPAFVRRRAVDTVNVLINITNDGWFGRSPGPFHHLQMARLRCIENGIPLVRCANTGISTCVDALGRRLGSSRLYERTVLCVDVSLERVATPYSVLGDWVVWAAFAVALAAGAWGLHGVRTRRGHG